MSRETLDRYGMKEDIIDAGFPQKGVGIAQNRQHS